MEITSGAIIKALGERAEVKDVLFQHIDVENDDPKRWWADVEFYDTNGKYRHWQSWSDGGTLVTKYNTYKFEREV